MFIHPICSHLRWPATTAQIWFLPWTSSWVPWTVASTGSYTITYIDMYICICSRPPDHIYIYTFMLCFGICCICAFLVYLIDLYIYSYILYTVYVFKHTHFRNWHLFGVPGRWYSSLTLLHTSWPQPWVNITDVTKHQKSNSTIYKCFFLYSNLHIYIYMYIHIYVHFLYSEYLSSDLVPGFPLWV